MIKINLSGVAAFAETINISAAQTAEATAAQLPMCGWKEYPTEVTTHALEKIKTAGQRIADTSDALVVLGAGGSSLGARTLTDALPRKKGVAEIFFAGDNLSGEYMARLIRNLENKEISVIVTSKSGTTTETAAALRIFLPILRERYGDAALSRLYVVAGEGKSKLRDFAEGCGCEIFGIPENIGGRYSVLTAAGLLPAAAYGLDISEIIGGAVEEKQNGAETAWSYAATRQALYKNGCRTELFAAFEPAAKSLGDWWRQLFGESEGKLGRGIFPSTVSYSGDLHSMGQYVQEGPRDLFETIVSFEKTNGGAVIPPNREFDDGFDFLTNRKLDAANNIARDAVKTAHIAGGVPVISLEAPALDEASLGALMYFFMRACAASAILSGVTPFEQPGVEAYKKLMLFNLGKT